VHNQNNKTKNLDVLGPDQEQNIGGSEGAAGSEAETCFSISLGSSTATAHQPEQREHTRRHRYRDGGTKYITLPQAANIIEAVRFAKSVGFPLVAHLTVHWACTDVGDDHEGKLFAKLREGLDKWLGRQGIAFAAVWARERQSRGQSDVVHCHLLFHLPVKYRTGKRLLEVEAAIYSLIDKHGRRDGDKKGHGYWADEVIKLVIHDNPDGKYLIKGGGPQIWKRFGLRKEHRRWQGIIHGKRCGTTVEHRVGGPQAVEGRSGWQ
jgi:hypothetical protein